MVEHHVANVMVVGSSPIARSIFFTVCEHSSVVEHHVANVMVVGSSPISRSIFLYRLDSFDCL